MRAVVVSFLVSWLFLPIAGYEIEGLPEYTKMSATCYGILLGTLLFNSQYFFLFRPHWLDLSVVGLCAIPLASGVSYGWGAYDGMSAVLNESVSWGLPYFLGRVYFRNEQDFRFLATAVVLAGLVYVPLVGFEMRMSPQLHHLVYGFHQHSFAQTMRGGGWRPMVFMQHGLAVAFFMWGSGIVAWVAWRSRELQRVFGIPIQYAAWTLVLMALFCRSTGASVIGLSVLCSFEFLRAGWRIPSLMLVIAPAVWVVSRTFGSITVESVHGIAALIFSEERVQSLLVRLRSESGVWELSKSHFWFGANRFIYAGEPAPGGGKIIPDSLWIILLCCRGVVGLALWISVITLAPLRTICKHSMQRSRVSNLVVAMSLVVTAWSIDCLANAMLNPLNLLLLGAVTSYAVSPSFARARVSLGVGYNLGDGRSQYRESLCS